MIASPPLTPLEASIVESIVRRAADQPAAAAVWLFGSRARGASTEHSDLDVAIEFDAAETAPMRSWLEQVREEAESPVVEQWPGFVDLVGLYAGDPDPRLAERVRAEGIALWRRAATVTSPDPVKSNATAAG